ncbi:unnamed protein product [Cochlearia groenlandica]
MTAMNSSVSHRVRRCGEGLVRSAARGIAEARGLVWLEAWLALRPKLSYVASDFELLDELGVAAVPEVSSRDEESGRVEGESSRGDQRDGSEPDGEDGLGDMAGELAQD